MSRQAIALRALGLAAALIALQVAAAMAVGAAAEIASSPFDSALLFLGSGVLGTVWALRQHFEDAPEVSSSASFAWVPVVAVAFFAAPQLVRSSASAMLPLAAVLLVAPLAELGWSHLIAPRDVHARPLRAALAAGPVLGLALATGVPYLIAVGMVLAGVIGALAVMSVQTIESEEQAFIARVNRVSVRPDEVASLPPRRFRDRRLRARDRQLTDRINQWAVEAIQDASAREEIADARALRTRFMAVMSHELRSPLNSIVGFTEVLDRGLDGPLSEGQRESVTMIQRSAGELILLLTDVLDLARLEAGRLSLDRAWTPSVEILTESVSRGRTLVEGRDVTIEAELQPGLPPVHVDARRIVQAVVALFRSSASVLRRTTILVRARTAEGPPGPTSQLRVEIHHAIGVIPAGEVSNIFEAFQEIAAPTGRRLGGLGMALTLSRGLVRLHGGEVWAEPSRAEGTVLCLAIPLDDAPSSP
ncbi:MAG: sensor histidine kinase [Sandaracinaceae bacterium]